jgi:hypothetical protein|nr:MAG TPA: hypothetical protein [Caudoviricetes sp.]
MLHTGGRKIEGIYYGRKIITKVYQGTSLVWQLIKSCFGAGYWVKQNPWLGSDSWKNNKQ